MSKYILFSFFVLSFVACNNAPEATEAAQTEQVVADENQFFGEKITADNAIAFDDLVGQMDSNDSLNVKFEGLVESVCKKKGCWTNVKSETTGKEMFVKFKDYGFFLPKDCEGQKVIMEGVAYREVTSVDELRHYAEDEGASEEEIAAITEPKDELKFMASGVILAPKSKDAKQ